VSPEQLGQVLSRAQPLPCAFVVLVVTASLFTRAVRWQVFFLPERHVPLRPLLSTLSISYMASTFLPFRAGELVRAVFLGRRESLPIPRIVGTILLEKLFDFLAIGVMLTLMLLIAPPSAEARAAGGFIVATILAGFGFVVALAIWREPTLGLVAGVERLLPFGVGSRLKLRAAASHFAEGTDSLRRPGLWVPLLGWTTITWLFSFLGSWAGTAALDVHPGPAALIFLSVLPSASQAVPSSPGYVGVYHAAATLALTSFGVEQSVALGIAVLIHAFSYGILVILGLVALWVDGYSISDLLSGVRGSAVSSAAVPPPA
jgi:glycosyltransferase 2 family protein